MSVRNVMQAARQGARQLAHHKAEEARDTALELHRTAPRGGRNLNQAGQPRSAPGEPPAIDTGQLQNLIENGLTLTPDGARVTVNYALLEYGTPTIAPRPLGRLTLERLLKQ